MMQLARAMRSPQKAPDTVEENTAMRWCLHFFAFLAWFWAAFGAEFQFDIENHVQFGGFGDNGPVDTGNLTDRSLLWGPYRSALYFGVRPRFPFSLLSGLMWFNVDGYGGVGRIRHFYEQGDNMGRANWIRYDPRYGGTQVIEDLECHVTIQIDFVKSEDGLLWAAKVKARPHEGHERVRTSFVWYSGLEGETGASDPFAGSRSGVINLDNKKNFRGYSGDVVLSGGSEELGLFELTITDGPATNVHPSTSKLVNRELDPKKTHHLSLVVPDNNVWMARDIFITLLQESVQDLVEQHGTLEGIPPEQAYVLRDMHKFEGNVHMVQKLFQGACEFDILFDNAETIQKLTTENLPQRIAEMTKKVDAKFEKHFKLQAPFDKDPLYKEFAQEVVGGLLGGLTYMHGDHLVDRDTVLDDELFESLQLVGNSEGPHELFTLVPSRPFFPRGFLWDEGFHVLPLLEYDSDLVLEILQLWFHLIDDDGWIAREQILGPEARSRVPAEFQVQSPEIVNPPTLMLAFSYLLASTEKRFAGVEEPRDLDTSHSGHSSTILDHPERLEAYARDIYPRLKTHYHWFRRTQRGYVEEFDRGDNTEAFRWRGRTETHSLASGLDDYPRADPADVAELNVDLLAWVGVMTRSMIQMAGVLGLEDDQKQYRAILADVVDNLEALHWSEEHKTYCDVSIDDDEENTKVCHKGYVSLFPFITKMIPDTDTDKIGHMVDLISDPDELWSEYGVRSLSKSSGLYRSGENYWRSPVWLNINYLVLDALKHYHAAAQPGSALGQSIAATYSALRINVVENVFQQWKKTGFLWEQYDDISGDAQRAKNFLGWTSTVVLMMAMDHHLE